MNLSHSKQENSEWEVVSQPLRRSDLSEEDQLEYTKTVKSKSFSKCIELILNLISAYKKLNLHGSTCDRAKLNKVQDKIEGLRSQIIEEQSKLSEKENIIWIAWEEIEAIGKEHCNKIGVDTTVLDSFWGGLSQGQEQKSYISGFLKATANVFKL